MILIENLIGAKDFKDRIEEHIDVVKTMLDYYEAELFQESYLPEYQRKIAEKIRKIRMEAELTKRREEEAKKKIEQMDEED